MNAVIKHLNLHMKDLTPKEVKVEINHCWIMFIAYLHQHLRLYIIR